MMLLDLEWRPRLAPVGTQGSSEYRFHVLQPMKVQAWREGEITDRTVMREGRWLTADRQP
jgi:hypothetical protein